MACVTHGFFIPSQRRKSSTSPKDGIVEMMNKGKTPVLKDSVLEHSKKIATFATEFQVLCVRPELRYGWQSTRPDRHVRQVCAH